jgi:5-methylcytosine-specific restriction endonuclease McrA
MNGKIQRISKADIERIYLDVIERDNSVCILCMKAADDVAHIVPRSSSVKRDASLFQHKNLACLCRDCHSDGENLETRIEMIRVLHARWNYDYSDEIYAEYLGFLED